MQKGKSVIGKDVLSRASGVRVHSVKDILIGFDNDQVVALLVDEGGLLGTSTVVPFEAISSIGRDAVVIEREDLVVPASSDPNVKAIVDRTDKLLGKSVFTEDGQKMGTIADLYFDDTSGKIVGFEVSGGALGDLARGPSYLATDDLMVAGKDVVLISRSGGEALDGQVGGLQGRLAEAGEKLGAAGEDAKQKLGAAGEDAKQKLGAAGEDAKQKLAAGGKQLSGPEPTPEERLVGKRSGADVTDERGSIVVASGQRISEEHVQRAKTTGNLQLLYDAADAADARERDQRTQAAVQQAGDTAGDLWDKFTAKLGEITDSAGQRVDDQQTRNRLAQINDAIGRPVTKVILDRNDDVILDLGDIITHQAIQQTDEAGLLETLLACVYKGDVAFERDEMRAKVDATSTVEKASGGATIVDELSTKVETANQERAKAAEEKKQQDQQAREQRSKEREKRATEREEATQELEDADQEPRESVAVQMGSSGTSR